MTTKVRASVLADTAVTPEKYGGTQTLQTITVDAQGRITYAANITSGVVTADTTGQGASILVPSIRFNALGQIVEATNTTIRSATTSVTGVVQLVDSVSSTSTTTAATASAVKAAYDAAGTNAASALTSAQANTGAALITALNASNISSGTLPSGRISGSYTGITGVGTLTAGTWNATSISTTYTDAKVTSVATRTGAVTLSQADISGLTTASSPTFAGLTINGAITATGDITAYYSDDRLKTKLGNIVNALDKVIQLNGFYYEANQTAQDLGYSVKREVGVSAQEVQSVFPEVVVPAPIDNQYLTVHYEKLIPLLIEAIKELTEKVEVLENKIKNN
jgi:hypothetical protein